MWRCSCGGDSIVLVVTVTVEVGTTMVMEVVRVAVVMGVLGVNRAVMVDVVVMGVEVKVVMALMMGMKAEMVAIRRW